MECGVKGERPLLEKGNTIDTSKFRGYTCVFHMKRTRN